MVVKKAWRQRGMLWLDAFWTDRRLPKKYFNISWTYTLLSERQRSKVRPASLVHTWYRLKYNKQASGFICNNFPSFLSISATTAEPCSGRKRERRRESTSVKFCYARKKKDLQHIFRELWSPIMFYVAPFLDYISRAAALSSGRSGQESLFHQLEQTLKPRWRFQAK